MNNSQSSVHLAYINGHYAYSTHQQDEKLIDVLHGFVSVKNVIFEALMIGIFLGSLACAVATADRLTSLQIEGKNQPETFECN
ncbi:hypothetical protein [Methyloglobulus sp.]|uniref:hypothetical protein n=1 Tax=Methyloglobulus sp. TaxID=2518622 RepID=UPI0032B802EC